MITIDFLSFERTHTVAAWTAANTPLRARLFAADPPTDGGPLPPDDDDPNPAPGYRGGA